MTDEAAAKKTKMIRIGGAVALLVSLTCCCMPSCGWLGYVNLVDNPSPPGPVHAEWDRRRDDLVEAAEALALVCPDYIGTTGAAGRPSPIGPDHPIRAWDNLLMLELECSSGLGMIAHEFPGHGRRGSVMGWPMEPSDGSWEGAKSFFGTTPGYENTELAYWRQMPNGETIVRITIHRELSSGGSMAYANVTAELRVP